MLQLIKGNKSGSVAIEKALDLPELPNRVVPPLETLDVDERYN